MSKNTVRPYFGYSPSEALGKCTAYTNNTPSWFTDRYTPQELFTLWLAYNHCSLDLTPDQWSVRQVLDALGGIVPIWNKHEQPIYRRHRRRFDISTGAWLK